MACTLGTIVRQLTGALGRTTTLDPAAKSSRKVMMGSVHAIAFCGDAEGARAVKTDHRNTKIVVLLTRC